MANLEAVVGWLRKVRSIGRYKWTRRDICRMIYEGIESYDGQQPSSTSTCCSYHKPPIKLEAGCWVRSHEDGHKGIVQYLYGCTRVIWLDDNALPWPPALRISDPSKLAVIEAATPEMGDHVRIDHGSHKGYCGSITELEHGNHQCFEVGVIYHWGVSSYHFHRSDFTITHKAEA